MQRYVRKRWLIGFSLAAAVLFCLSNWAAAKKPPKDDVPAPGTIFYHYQGPIWQMKPDGSGKTLVTEGPFGAPSKHAYWDAELGEIRWLLETRDSAKVYDHLVYVNDDGQTMTIDDYPQREIFAVGMVGSDIVAEVQVTDFFGDFMMDGAQWSDGATDSFISILGDDVSNAVSESPEGFTTLDWNMIGPRTIARLWVSGADIAPGIAPVIREDSLFEEVVYEDDAPIVRSELARPGHTWSPDGRRLAFLTRNTSWSATIWTLTLPDTLPVGGVPASEATPIFTEHVQGVSWSPVDESKILYWDNGYWYVIDPDTTDVEDLGINSGAALWSPDGQHVVYLAYRQSPSKRWFWIDRMRLSDGAVVRMTNDLDSLEAKGPIAWTY